MARLLQRSIVATMALAAALAAILGLALAGCSGAVLSDHLPNAMGGLPEGAPARAGAEYTYPAVHDMPPPRATEPMSDVDQDRLEKDLKAARDSQEAAEKAAVAQDAQDAQGGADKKTAPPAKVKPAAVKKKPGPTKPGPITLVPAAAADPSGAKTTGAKTNP